ncbi:MAG: HAMP domain-containing histidine kinase [Draconibacterium sp.]|nr:HAMP domain-containing histidine kinase [Draconibacterium sp.]
MKKTIQKYILGFTLIIIFTLLLTQVRWIVYSIKFQEKVFQKSVTLALNQTINHLTQNKRICSVMQQCVACDTVKLEIQLTSTGIWEKIHNAIDSELKSYEIDLDYDFFIVETGSDTIKFIKNEILKGKYYSQCLHEIIGQTGYDLVVRFPSRTRFFFEKTGLMFLSSVVLIFLLILSISYLLKLYRRELRIAEHTKELLNNVSHEFKTPLSSIALASNMIRKKRYSNNDKLKNYADLIFNENKKLEHLVESLLHLAAIERNEFDYSKMKLNIHEIIKDGISTVEMILFEKGGKIEIDFDAVKNDIIADKLHLTNVVVNLLSNAIKYSKESPNIKITTKNIEDKILITVKDNGIGIALKYQKYIFDKYYRVPTGDVHNTKGFGIGLAYVKKVVEAHDGNVEIESELNRGTTIKILLPLFN